MYSKKYRIAQVRGVGLMNAIELFDDKEGIASKVAEAARKKGLAVASFGAYETIALVPPLIITEEQVTEVLQKLEQAFEATM